MSVVPVLPVVSVGTEEVASVALVGTVVSEEDSVTGVLAVILPVSDVLADKEVSDNGVDDSVTGVLAVILPESVVSVGLDVSVIGVEDSVIGVEDTIIGVEDSVTGVLAVIVPESVVSVGLEVSERGLDDSVPGVLGVTVSRSEVSGTLDDTKLGVEVTSVPAEEEIITGVLVVSALSAS